MPTGNPGDTTVGPLSLVGANGDVPSALPALAAAAASAAQVVSTIAAGAAADKKSHDSQSQIASTSGASSTSDAAGAAQLLSAQGTTHTDSSAVPTFKVNATVDSPEFSQNVATHVSTMLDGNVNSAKLQVNPPALGPIEVRISIQGDHAQVWMASHSAVTRDALQDAAPHLREMLSSQGFAQVSVDISQRSFQERTPTAHAYEWNGESDGASRSASGSAASVTSRASSGILDAYA
jgi:flagellar hook-length control protein FliK